MDTLAKFMELLETPEEFKERFFTITAQTGLFIPILRELKWISQGGNSFNLLELSIFWNTPLHSQMDGSPLRMHVPAIKPNAIADANICRIKT